MYIFFVSLYFLYIIALIFDKEWFLLENWTLLKLKKLLVFFKMVGENEDKWEIGYPQMFYLLYLIQYLQIFKFFRQIFVIALIITISKNKIRNIEKNI